MRADRTYWHGDIDPDYPGNYYCHIHKTTHPIEGMQPRWSDLYAALIFTAVASEDRPVDARNVFRPTAALAYKRNHKRLAPYKGAPQDYSCRRADVAARLLPTAVPVCVLEEWLAPHAGAFETIVARLEQGLPKAPTPRAEMRARVYLHGDLDPSERYYFCTHHNAWHSAQDVAPPLPGDVHHVQRARKYEHNGRSEYRKLDSPTVWPGKIAKRGRPKPLPTEACDAFACVRHGETSYTNEDIGLIT